MESQTGQRSSPAPGWQDVIGLLPDGVLLADENDTIVFANPRLAELTGYPVEELLGQPVGVLVPEHARARQAAHHRTGTPRLLGADEAPPLLCRDGSTVPVEVALAPVTVDGRRHVLALLRDTTRLRPGTASQGRAEARKPHPSQAQDELLRVSEQAFRTAFEHSPIGVCVAAPESEGGGIRMANRALADILGTTVDDLTGRPLLGFAVEADRQRAMDLLRKLTSGACSEISGMIRFRRGTDGGTVWTESHARMFALPGESGPLVLEHLVDVSGFITQQARLTRTARLQASISDVTTAALVGEPTSALLQRIVAGAASMLDGDGAALVLGVPHTDQYRLMAVHGSVLESLPLGTLIPVTADATPGLDDDILRLPVPPETVPEPFTSTLGPLALSRFEHVDGQPGGYLTVVRSRGEEEFTDGDLHALKLLAEQTRLALQLSWARRDQQRLALIEDRQRIARDLHDVVIQDLIALGMELVSAAEAASPDRARPEDLNRITRLEAAVRQLRRVVFELRVPERQDTSQAVQALAADVGRVLGHVPEVTLEGPVDSLPEDVSHDILGVLREALSNVARHATAGRTRVRLTVEGSEVRLLVEDDGPGMPADLCLGQGIPNIRQRATARQGRAEFSSSELGGARLSWSCRLPFPTVENGG